MSGYLYTVPLGYKERGYKERFSIFEKVESGDTRNDFQNFRNVERWVKNLYQPEIYFRFAKKSVI